jgi:hypothetical protein
MSIPKEVNELLHIDVYSPIFNVKQTVEDGVPVIALDYMEYDHHNEQRCAAIVKKSWIGNEWKLVRYGETWRHTKYSYYPADFEQTYNEIMKVFKDD